MAQSGNQNNGNQASTQGTYQSQSPRQGYPFYQHGYSTGQSYPTAPAVIHPNKQQDFASKQKPRHSRGFVAAIIIAIIAVVLAAVFGFMSFMPDEPKSNRAGVLGQLEGKTPEEIQAELDRVVSEGMFNISIASTIEFEDGASEGEMKIENVPGNPYLMQVSIVRNDNDETIYKSGILEQNHHIQWAPLDVDLDPGTYECTAVFRALDPETEEEIGRAAAVVHVVVKS